jgi:hypothetical protein
MDHHISMHNWGLHPKDDPLKILYRLSSIWHVSAWSRSVLHAWMSTMSWSTLWIRSSTTMRAQRSLGYHLSLASTMSHRRSFLSCFGIRRRRFNLWLRSPLLPSPLSHVENDTEVNGTIKAPVGTSDVGAELLIRGPNFRQGPSRPKRSWIKRFWAPNLIRF